MMNTMTEEVQEFTLKDVNVFFKVEVDKDAQILMLMNAVSALTEVERKSIALNNAQYTQALEIISQHNQAQGEKSIQATQLRQYLDEQQINVTDLLNILQKEGVS